MSSGKSPMLHELLAVQGDLEGKYKRILEEATETFTKRKTHFSGYHKTLRMFAETDKMQEAAGEEHKELTDTVDAKLNYIQSDIVRLMDALLQKESTNQNAKADLVVDGITLGSNLPATWLLGMETKLKEIRSVYEAIPTLDPGVKWEPDPAAGAHVYRATHPDVKSKTVQDIAYKVLQPATKEHPAQVETWKENKPVGEYVTHHVSGAISPAQKSVLLGRIDNLLRAVKKARMRANNTPVDKARIGNKLFDYIHIDHVAVAEEE